MDFQKASTLFDQYIDWDRRLKKEMPFLLERLEAHGAKRVADVACGTGFHAAALAKAGLRVTALDPDPDLLEKARVLAGRQGVSVAFEKKSFAELPGRLAGCFDAAVCLGNSIALAAPGAELEGALTGMGALMKPGGLLFAHTVNFPMLANRANDPWGPVRTLKDGSLLMKGFLPRERGPWDVLLIHMEKKPAGAWVLDPVRFQVHPHGIDAMKAAGAAAGLCLETVAGGFFGESPEAPSSADLLYEFTRMPAS